MLARLPGIPICQVAQDAVVYRGDNVVNAFTDFPHVSEPQAIHNRRIDRGFAAAVPACFSRADLLSNSLGSGREREPFIHRLSDGARLREVEPCIEFVDAAPGTIRCIL